MFELDLKLIMAALAAILAVGGTVPYIIDTLKGRSQPHIYTWFIWLVTVGTAAFVSLEGGGGAAAYALFVSLAVVTTVFLLSLRYGTKNITRSDTAALVAAFVMVIVWWQLESPLLAVLMATAIDGVGYIPTYRKSYEEPWSETKVFWLISALSGVFALLAIDSYNLLTVTYLVAIMILNAGVFLLLIWRRRLIPAPQSKIVQ